MPGSAALAAFALQLLTALEGPALGTGDAEPWAGPSGPAFTAEPAHPPTGERAPSWLTVRRAEARSNALAAAGPPAPPQ
jgi:hypothetical protein